MATTARANHLLGGEINYSFVSSTPTASVYKLTLTFFADCSSNIPGQAFSALNGADPQVSLMKGDVTIFTQRLDYDAALSNIEITPVCPDEANNTTCININNPIPGIKKFVYSRNFTLPGTASNWRFVFMGDMSTAPPTSAGRSSIIQNAVIDNTQGSGSLMYLEATLNNTLGNNNSTTFSSLPTPFFCINKAANYTLGATDAENDSLHFTLIPAKALTQNSAQVFDVEYVLPYTAQLPLPTAAGNFFFSDFNGQMSFTPNLVLNCLVTNLVEEYRNGVKIGSSMREMTFVILDNCNNDAPNTPVSGIQNANINTDPAGNLLLSVCEGQVEDIKFTINAQDPNSDNVVLTYSNLPDSATITVDSNNTSHPTAHFSWNLTDAPPGNYIFYITYTDDGCPLASHKTVAYTITINPHPVPFETGIEKPCIGMANGKSWAIPENGVAVNYNYNWEDVTGTQLRDVFSTDGDSLLNIPAGNYLVRVRNPQGCGKNIKFNVPELPLPELNLRTDTLVCKGIPIPLSPETIDSSTIFKWNTGDSTCCIIGKETGYYTLTATNICGSVSDSVYLEFVKCNYCLFVPNAFTPNDDGNNDVFKITPTCVFYKYRLMIYNRWGQMIYKSYNLENSWDGTYNGRVADVGVYYYVIDATPEDRTKGEIHLKGDITLVR
jgi:gliding motility-associated-like protein